MPTRKRCAPTGPSGFRREEFQQIHFADDGGFRSTKTYATFVRSEIRRGHEIQAVYDAEVAEFYADPVNIGYAFPRCIHGASRVTDYDNICGGCESDESLLSEAIGRARERFLRFNARWDWANDAPGDLDHETRQKIMGWAVDIVLDASNRAKVIA